MRRQDGTVEKTIEGWRHREAGEHMSGTMVPTGSRQPTQQALDASGHVHQSLSHYPATSSNPEHSLDKAALPLRDPTIDRATVAYEAIASLRSEYDRVAQSGSFAGDTLTHTQLLTTTITEAFRELLELKTTGGVGALHRADGALAELARQMEIHPTLPPGMAVWRDLIKTLRENLSEKSGLLTVNDLSERLNAAIQMATNLTPEVTIFQAPKGYLDICTEHFMYYKEALSAYANNRTPSEAQQASIQELSGALGEVVRLGSETSLLYQDALRSVLELSTKLREQGFSCAALRQATLLSAERLATIQLNTPVTCEEKREKKVNARAHDVWTRVVGDEPQMATVARNLTNEVTLVPASPEKLETIAQERNEALASERAFANDLSEEMKKIAGNKQLGTSARGDVSVSPDIAFAPLSTLQTLASHRAQFFKAPASIVAWPLTATTSALFAGAAFSSGAEPHIMFGLGALVGTVTAAIWWHVAEYNRARCVLDTSKPSSSPALDTFLAYCKANNVRVQRTRLPNYHNENQVLSWFL